jgi:hypothetical protein
MDKIDKEIIRDNINMFSMLIVLGLMILGFALYMSYIFGDLLEVIILYSGVFITFLIVRYILTKLFKRQGE